MICPHCEQDIDQETFQLDLERAHIEKWTHDTKGVVYELWLFAADEEDYTSVELDEEEYNHLKNVLRTEGDLE